MHFAKDRISVMAEENTKLTDQEQLHLKKCDKCGELFRIFVLQRLYGRTNKPLAEYLLAQS